MNALLHLKGEGFEGCQITVTLPAPYLLGDGFINSKGLDGTPYDTLVAFTDMGQGCFVEGLKLGPGIIVQAVRMDKEAEHGPDS